MADDEKRARLEAVRKIVTHPGLAHVDDIMACALAYAFGVPHGAVVERRRPTPEELDDPTILVLDVGLVCDPSRMDFDHHQRSRTESPKCSYKLFAEWLGVEAELQALFPWYETWNLIDVIGPFAVAAQIGCAGDGLAGFVSNPLADWVIRHFADDPAFRSKVAIGLANEIDKTRRCWVELQQKASMLEINGLPVADMRSCAPQEISRCSEAWIRINRPACIIQYDSRGDGLTFLRCNDDPRLDFSRSAGKPYALFAHPGGFVLKTVSCDVDAAQILQDATVAG